MNTSSRITAVLEAPHITQLREQGYAAVRSFLPPGDLARVAEAVDEVYAEGMTHHATYLSADRDRRLILNRYVRASDSPDRGEWACRGGVSTPLGPELQLCRFEDLRDHPEPFYIEEEWIVEKTSG